MNIRRVMAIAAAALLSVAALWAESAQEILGNKAYLKGRGYGETLDEARKAALNDILQQISVTVKTDFILNEKQQNVDGKEINYEQKFESTMRTYSGATLTQVKTLVLQPEPDADVLMWIPEAEIDRIFDGRQAKAKEFVRNADNALASGQIDDALRYYYWAYKLVQSLRHPAEATISVDGEERQMEGWLNAQIGNVMAGLQLMASRQLDDHTWELNATWQGKPVRSMEYVYFDGVDNSLTGMRDGRGLIEMRPGVNNETVNVKVEYEFRGIADVTDREVADVLAAQGISRFNHAYVMVPLTTSATTKAPKQQAALGAVKVMDSPAQQITTQTTDQLTADAVLPVMHAIETGDTVAAKKLFTADGWTDFKNIMRYGKVRLLPEAKLEFFTGADGSIVCRGIPVSCKFQGRRTFTEQLTLAFDKQGKVEHVSMGIGQQMADDIALLHDGWNEDSRKRLVDFLEDYRTAYALKDVEWLQNVFDDNAVIVVGRKATIAKHLNDGQWQNNQRVVLTKYTKDEFIKHLRRSFNTKEYINLHFSNSRILKARPDKEIYSVEVKQDYYSSNYGDTGYLTLIFDLQDPKNPVIHVRTWQEEPDPQFGVISLPDF